MNKLIYLLNISLYGADIIVKVNDITAFDYSMSKPKSFATNSDLNHYLINGLNDITIILKPISPTVNFSPEIVYEFEIFSLNANKSNDRQILAAKNSTEINKNDLLNKSEYRINFKLDIKIPYDNSLVKLQSLKNMAIKKVVDSYKEILSIIREKKADEINNWFNLRYSEYAIANFNSSLREHKLELLTNLVSSDSYVCRQIDWANFSVAFEFYNKLVHLVDSRNNSPIQLFNANANTITYIDIKLGQLTEDRGLEIIR